MIRVLNVLPALNYCGGIENYAMAYYRHIDKKKVQFDFITHTNLPCSFGTEIEGMGGRIYPFPEFTIKNFGNIYNDIVEFFKAHREYDVIHCHMANAAFMYLPIAMKFGIKVRIVHSHNTKYADKITHAMRNRLLVAVGLQFATHRIACTKKAGDFLFGKKKYEIIKNAIDCERYAYNAKVRNKMRKMYGVEDRIILGNIARFVPQKNHIFMIDLLRSLLRIDSRYMLCFVGDGELFERIKDYASDIKDHVLYAGVQRNVEDYYNMFDVFILPSIYEGLGIVNIEAQCSGVPVIVSDAVPPDVKVTSLIEFLPLMKDAWVNKIITLTQKDNNRNTYLDDIKKSGYDIRYEAEKLMEMYGRFLNEYSEEKM